MYNCGFFLFLFCVPMCFVCVFLCVPVQPIKQTNNQRVEIAQHSAHNIDAARLAQLQHALQECKVRLHCKKEIWSIA